MIQISQARDGTLTQVTAALDDASLLPQVQSAFRNTSRYTSRDGLIQSVCCNSREAARIVQALAEINAVAGVATPEAPVAPAAMYRHRELLRSGQYAEGRAEATVFVGGQALRLTGYGREFMAGESYGDLWGETVRYAYYA